MRCSPHAARPRFPSRCQNQLCSGVRGVQGAVARGAGDRVDPCGAISAVLGAGGEGGAFIGSSGCLVSRGVGITLIRVCGGVVWEAEGGSCGDRVGLRWRRGCDCGWCSAGLIRCWRPRGHGRLCRGRCASQCLLLPYGGRGTEPRGR